MLWTPGLSDTVYPGWILAFGVASWATVKIYRMRSRGADLPPGPPTVPVLGNLPLLKKGSTFIEFTAWARQYGEIYSLMGGPTGTMVVLTSPHAIHEVMEKQGALTVDRPKQWVIDYITGGMMVGLSQNNAYLRATRRAAFEVLRPAACAEHLPIQVAESAQLQFDIMNSPGDTFLHIQRYSLSVMLSVIYGQRTPMPDSPMRTRILGVFKRLQQAFSPNFAPPVDLFPILRNIPERWAPWKTACADVRHAQRKLYFGLLNDCEERVQRGEPTECYMETVLARAETFKLNKEEICYFGSSMMGGGILTSAAWLHFFVLCMTAYPSVQKKAQAEIDRVIGSERTPNLQDIDSLPYVQAIIKEVSRFRPLVPMCLPHVSSADVAYKNYRIPAGSVLFPNFWGVFRDESLYKNAEDFDPERFVESPLGLRKEVEIADDDALKRLPLLPWGCGRRACPGIALANQTLAMNSMALLWAFDFTKARDANDKEIEVDLLAFSRGATVDVDPFVINPGVRSPERADIIRRNFFASSEVFERFERELGEEDRIHIRKTRTSIV